MTSIVDRILGLFASRGSAAYHGEAVSQREHAEQSAALAVAEGAADALVVAALLHDVGHLLDGQDEDMADRGIDGRHEVAGHDWLASHFGPEVTEPVRLHVEAKRYLCGVDSEYLSGLSPASQKSLELQGGPMSPDERQTFESLPFFEDAVRLRRWDDTAKVPGLHVPEPSDYRARMEAVLENR